MPLKFLPKTQLDKLIIVLSLVAVASLCQSRAATFTPVTADDQAAAMHRGINVLDDDPGQKDPSAARFQPRLFATIRDAGFDTVRLNMHPFAHLRGNAIDGVWLAMLDRMSKAALDAGLTVVLDVHDDNACQDSVTDCRTKLRAVWSVLAPRYRGASNRLLFEILNEPHGILDAGTWNGVLREMLTVIRASNPARNVVIGPTDYDGLWELGSLDLPESDRHIIATVHTYTPVTFTLQGARWVPSAKDHSNVSWGSDADKAAIVKAFDRVETWSNLHRRPVFLGEFGVYEKAPMDSRVRWLSAVSRIAEAHGVPWAYWQFDTDFAVYDIPQDRWIAPVLNALVPSN
ncbi:MAG TPA: glycoside hydrolase family 5 protein [Rhizomicrobium sp.]|jgi:endoglucanase|nr:glycoside hydrolase family 5 protein [Rhizomicrobium sp.]